MDIKPNRNRFIEDVSNNRRSSSSGDNYLRSLNTGTSYRPQTSPKPQQNTRLRADNTPKEQKPQMNAGSRPAYASNSPSSSSSYQPRSILNTTLPNNSYADRRNGYDRSGPRPKAKKPGWFRRHKIITSFLVLFLLIFGVGGYFGSRIIGNIDKVFHGNVLSDAQAFFSTTRLKGESSGRVNIILAGYQGKQSDEGALTDSIMIVSLDTRNNTALTVSIPRDLLVHIPGMGYQKINAANSASNFNQPGYFKGGMGQLQQIIEQDFGIPIDYYALIDYNAFEQAVNAVGGINIVIHSPDPRGLYDPNVNAAHGGPVKLPNGPVHLNGIHALALALARGDSPYAYGFPKSDINREQHQRQMLIALEQKALSAGVISNPLKITRLFDALGSNVRTNLSLADALRLVHLLKADKLSNLKSYGLSYGPHQLLTTYYSSSAGDSLIPQTGINNYTQIQNYFNKILAVN